MPTQTCLESSISALDFSRSSNRDIPIVDVRPAAEFREKHIEGAFNFPFDSPELDLLMSLRANERRDPLYVVCRGGVRSAMVCTQFPSAGLISIEGGVDQCEKEGMQLSRGNGPVSIERQVRIIAGFIIVAACALGLFVHPWFSALAGLAGAGLFVAGVTNSCAMGMLLAKMPWNQRRSGLSIARRH